MGDKTGIEWTNATWNPTRGCSRVSAGCFNCYAERVAMRFSGPDQPYEGLVKMVNGKPTWTGKMRLVEENLGLPLSWKKPRLIFVDSMSDLFHAEVPFSYVDRVFGMMACAPQHTFQILTKRPERMLEYITSRSAQMIHEAAKGELGYDNPKRRAVNDWPLPNVWLGVSAEDQDTANERIPLLMRTPAAVRWVSAEPMLGAIDFSYWIEPSLHCAACGARYDVAEAVPDPEGHAMGKDECADCGAEYCMTTDWGFEAHSGEPEGFIGEWDHGYRLHWVVAGGESGSKARPSHPDWFRSLRDQCAAAGVPFLFKQWGEWAPYDRSLYTDPAHDAGEQPLQCFGKKAAGRLLDGVEHNGYPTT